jgi:hypothetical protein
MLFCLNLLTYLKIKSINDSQLYNFVIQIDQEFLEQVIITSKIFGLFYYTIVKNCINTCNLKQFVSILLQTVFLSHDLNASHSNQKVWSKASTIQYFDPLMGQGYIWLTSKVQKTVEKM